MPTPPLIWIDRVTRHDRQDLIAANRDSREHHAPWAEPFLDEAGFEEWFGRTLTGANVGPVAREQAGGGVVGVINLNEIVLKGFQSAYLGYYGMRLYGGRGLITEAMRLAIDYCFTALGLHRLEANIQPQNLRSVALVRRLGFHKEGLSPRYLKIGGEWRDPERWAILADDPPDSP